MPPVLALALLVLIAGCAQAPTQPSPADAPLATVNGTVITQADVDRLLQQNPTLAQAEQPRQQALESLVNSILLAQWAREQGLEANPQVQQALDNVRRQTLINAAGADYLKTNPITAEAVQARYQQMVENTPSTQYHVRTIVVADQAQARRLIRQLQAGGSFPALARQRSLDSNSAQQGGDLGWVVPGNLPQPLGQALEGLEPGQISQPIDLGQAWAILKLEEAREVEIPPLAQAEARIRQQLQQEALQQYLQVLRQQAEIDVRPAGS
ncbi:MAG: peptidylprolyl isomerase [Candidatus Competibacteraceae bacterium]|nr:peptidylprolyl isomerase [Candidatus Competibacteraceae bacterium]